MSLITIENELLRTNENYYKQRISSEIIDLFGTNLKNYLKQIQQAYKQKEHEEHIKAIINAFLSHSFYQTDKGFVINTYYRADSSISHNGKLFAITEAKRKNNPEMVKVNNINAKALCELFYYYLEETRDTSGQKVRLKYESEMRRLIITDGLNWFLFDAQDFNKLCKGYIENLFYKFKNNLLTYSETPEFYNALKEHFELINVTKKLGFVYFNIEEEFQHKKNWKNIYKILSKSYLLKIPFIYDVGNEKQIVDLVTDVLQKKENNEKTTDIEEQIDMIFFEMYQINETEREIIRDYLSSEDK